jgi:hypothetical protein
LNEVLEKVGRSLVKPLVEFDIQRFIGRKASGNSLIEPESYLLFILRILWLLLLLRPSWDSQEASTQDRNDANHALRRYPPPRSGAAIPLFVGTEPGLPLRFRRHAWTSGEGEIRSILVHLRRPLSAFEIGRATASTIKQP